MVGRDGEETFQWEILNVLPTQEKYETPSYTTSNKFNTVRSEYGASPLFKWSKVV